MNRISNFLTKPNITILDSIIVSVLVFILIAILTKLWCWFYNTCLKKKLLLYEKRLGKCWRYLIAKPSVNDLIEIKEIPEEKRTKKQKGLLEKHQKQYQKSLAEALNRLVQTSSEGGDPSKFINPIRKIK